MKYCSLLFGLLLLTACSSDDMTSVSDPLEIELLSGGGSSITGETRGEGVITSSLTANLPISLLHQECPNDGTYPAYTTANCIYAELKHTDLINKQYRVLNNPKLYYRKDGGDTRFIGWYPHAEGLGVLGEKPTDNLSRWDADTKTVYVDIDGSTDIMLAQPITGNTDNRFGPGNSLKFQHVLTKVTVWVALEKAEYIPYWDEIATVEFVGKGQECQLKFPEANAAEDSYVVTPYFPFSSANLVMREKGGTGAHKPFTLSAKETEVGYAMFAPHASTEDKLTILITTVGDGVHHTATIPYGNKAEMRAGGAYDIYLTFTAKEVSATAQIKPWEKGKPSKPDITLGDGSN